jgi:hypothetical protein
MTAKLLRHFLNMTIKSKATYDQTKDMAAASKRFGVMSADCNPIVNFGTYRNCCSKLVGYQGTKKINIK